MNKKRWIGVGIAIILVVISIATPSIKKEETIESSSYFDEMMKKAMGEATSEETILEPGDKNSRILVLDLDGIIMSGGGGSPFSDVGYNHEFFLEQLDKALEDDSIKGILFKVNTPGGGVYESAEIRNKILELKEKNVPIYVSMGSMAASGGYYVSADADKIYAAKETITGSIGVISTVYDISEFLDEHGIKVHVYASGENKDMGSSFKAPTEEEKQIWEDFTMEFYDEFVSLIANGRNMDEEKVRNLADGRIYTATQGMNLGLVDELGYSEDALDGLIADNGLEGAEIFEYNYLGNSPFGNLFKMKLETSPANTLDSLIEVDMNNMPKLYYLYGGH